MRKVVIIGAGPAGLTAAYNLLKNSKNFEVVVLEENSQVGGLSKTVIYDGNRMDLGGHRFFTKDDEILNMWETILPIGNEKKDKVLLERPRVSHIFYNGKYFDYPVNLSFKTIKCLGLKDTIVAGFSYLKTFFHKLPEDNLENFYINRFGKKLYEVFFKDYTEKLWGIAPINIDSSWGSQRVTGISIKEVLKDYFKRLFKIKDKNKQTSLIDKFLYPKYGPGLMYEELSNLVTKLGGKVLLNSKVIGIKRKDNIVKEIIYQENNTIKKVNCDYLISSMPIKDLINAMNSVPKTIKNMANKLPYRDYVTVGVILDKIKNMNLNDTWIYVQSKKQKIGRIQVFNNWSKYLVNDKNTISLGLEYFCNENDDFWLMDDDKLKELAISELLEMSIIDKDTKVLNYHIERVKKAYPAYFGAYRNFPKIKKYLDDINNLYCIGRNGMHRYNNMDHSMKTALVCTDIIINNLNSKEDIWNVNTEKDYHEVKNEKAN